jgi:hypothetical protein
VALVGRPAVGFCARRFLFLRVLLKILGYSSWHFHLLPETFYKGVAQKERKKEKSEKNRRNGNRKDKEPKEKRKDRTNVRKRKSTVYITVSSLNRLVGKRNISDGWDTYSFHFSSNPFDCILRVSFPIQRTIKQLQRNKTSVDTLHVQSQPMAWWDISKGFKFHWRPFHLLPFHALASIIRS